MTRVEMDAAKTVTVLWQWQQTRVVYFSVEGTIVVYMSFYKSITYKHDIRTISYTL